MKAFVLATAVSIMAGQAGAVTFYGSLDGIVPPKYYGPVPPSGAEITIYTRDEWKSAHVFLRTTGRFDFASLGLQSTETLYPDTLGDLLFVGRSAYRILSTDYDPDFKSIVENLNVTWCWYGCEWGSLYGWQDEFFTRVEDGNEWQVKYVLGAPVPVPLPAAAPLLLAGTAALYAISRRRKS